MFCSSASATSCSPHSLTSALHLCVVSSVTYSSTHSPPPHRQPHLGHTQPLTVSHVDSSLGLPLSPNSFSSSAPPASAITWNLYNKLHFVKLFICLCVCSWVQFENQIVTNTVRLHLMPSWGTCHFTEYLDFMQLRISTPLHLRGKYTFYSTAFVL